MGIEQKYLSHTYSYLALRKAVGWIGILLPFGLMVGAQVIPGGQGFQRSISHYYHTGMRDIFVGSLSAIALFMFFYSGYEKIDDWAGNSAGVFALGVAWFPTTETGPLDRVGVVHLVFASLFFLTLSFFSLVLFTRTKGGETPTQEKIVRNRIYLVCGVVMILCLVAILIFIATTDRDGDLFPVMLVAETVALVAFGISWLTKGETMYADE